MTVLTKNFRDIESRIAKLNLPQGDWATEARTAALKRLRSVGMPERRDEYWRFTRPDVFNQSRTPPTTVSAMEKEIVFSQVDALQIVFDDGIFNAKESDTLALEYVSIDRLAESSSDTHWAKSLYGQLETNGQKPVPRPLGSLNTAFATDGILVLVKGSAPKPINIIYNQKEETSDVTLHHVVRLEAGAELTILESGPAAARLNNVIEVDVADGAVFHHIRTQNNTKDNHVATHIFARLGNASTFKSFTLTINGKLTRNECLIEITGDDAVAHVAGACIGDGNFHQDDTVFITHDATGCESRQVFKKVLRNGAVGVFQGKILVKAGAQKTDGYQISQSLLLDGDSQFLAKPELEIYADDVICSHGSTSGAIDEDALFYLRSRGISEYVATNLLTLAFLAEAMDEIEDEDMREMLTRQLEGWLERHRG